MNKDGDRQKSPMAPCLSAWRWTHFFLSLLFSHSLLLSFFPHPSLSHKNIKVACMALSLLTAHSSQLTNLSHSPTPQPQHEKKHNAKAKQLPYRPWLKPHRRHAEPGQPRTAYSASPRTGRKSGFCPRVPRYPRPVLCSSVGPRTGTGRTDAGYRAEKSQCRVEIPWLRLTSAPQYPSRTTTTDITTAISTPTPEPEPTKQTEQIPTAAATESGTTAAGTQQQQQP